MHNNQPIYHISAYDYVLPEALIARYPTADRTASRLLAYSSEEEPQHYQFSQLPALLQAGDVLVLNNTKVIPARIKGQKFSGGGLEILFERLMDDQTCLAQVKSSKPLKPMQKFKIADEILVTVLQREGQFYSLQLEPGMTWFELLDQYGQIPIPPYFQRKDETIDRHRYQTVYAQYPGAVAAPTAGLHFDQPLLEQLKRNKIEIVDLTLHVGAGTFSPVRVEDIRQHAMHSEQYQLDLRTWETIQRAKKDGRRVIAVGTTSLRVLESFAHQPQLFERESCSGHTDIFIYPGFEFRICDGLITNFHLPKSTLLMLVAAFIGFEEMHDLYALAIKEQYRFYSYGDAMFLLR